MRHAAPASDVLRWPGIGTFLRWRHARTSLQIVLLLVAIIVIIHGLVGPQIAPANLATVLTWVHYRGLLVVALLAAGNFFCTGCPFVLVRDVGRRLHAPSSRWPRWLRTKWIGIALLVSVLFAYELFDLWALPRTTAWLVLAYFAGALTIDLVFTGATFCKYLCPIGQFNFVASTMSPLEVRVRAPETCRTCHTADCIKGRREGDAGQRLAQRGCELGLFLPSKIGNLDCTFCLDCVQACPHDNVVLATRMPGLELVDGRRRSGIGRLARRWDIAALVVLFVFGGLLNAFAMTTPAFVIEQWLIRALGAGSEAPALGALFVVALGLIPLMVVGSAAAVTGWLTGGATSWPRTAARYVVTLLPLGLGVWLSHSGFHLLTGALTVIPVTQSAVVDWVGWGLLGAPRWSWTGLRPGSVFPLQLGFVLLGAMGSIAIAYLLSERDLPDRPWTATVPWAMATAVLAAAAMWIFSQPMEMRGVGLGG
jgi:ferredoxin